MHRINWYRLLYPACMHAFLQATLDSFFRDVAGREDAKGLLHHSNVVGACVEKPLSSKFNEFG